MYSSFDLPFSIWRYGGTAANSILFLYEPFMTLGGESGFPQYKCVTKCRQIA